MTYFQRGLLALIVSSTCSFAEPEFAAAQDNPFAAPQENPRRSTDLDRSHGEIPS